MSALKLSALPKPDEYNNLSKEAFDSLVSDTYEPFVIRGLAEDWPIVKADNAFEFLKAEAEKSGSLDTIVRLTRVPKASNKRMFYREDMRAMNFGTAELSLTNCFDRMNRGVDDADYAVQSVRLPSLFNDMLQDHHTYLLDTGNKPFIWFGHGLKIAPHFDEADNLAIVGAGKRRFTLFPPEQIANLYVGPLDHTPAGQAVSLVDINKPDLTRFPNYINAYKAALSVELNPGDAIFIPTPWWHHVEALGDFNVLMNYWWSDRRVSTATPLVALLHTLQSFNTMEKNRKQAWKVFLDHYLGEPEHVRGHIPEHAQGVLGELDLNAIKVLDAFIKQELNKN
jgi:hypothetical protein